MSRAFTPTGILWRQNLCFCSHSGNQANRAFPTRKSNLRGVHPTSSGKPCARIRLGGTLTYLGTFKTAQDAALVWNKAAVEGHGEFAQLNDLHA
jgi:hypothetical protein